MSHNLPLRAALIGLSSSAATSWAATAHLPGLLTPASCSKITIAALLNSSVDAAKAAIRDYKLPVETKAYGRPEDLAADPEIDLVICNTRVDKHYETILPSVKAGKDVFLEWPIAANLGQIRELVQVAEKSGSRVAIGLQRRWAPPIVKVRDILGGGKLGKVLSSTVQAYGGINNRDILPPKLTYFTQKEIGGNFISIGVAHGQCFPLTQTTIILTVAQSLISCKQPSAAWKNLPSTLNLSFNAPTSVSATLQPIGLSVKQSPISLTSSLSMEH